MFNEILVASVVIGITLAHHWAPVHNTLLLCAGDFVGLTRGLKFRPGGHMLRPGGPHLVGVKPGGTAHSAHTTAIAKRNTHGVISHAGQ